MSKENRTLDILLDNINEEWTWRVKELDDFKSVLEKTRDEPSKAALIRAGITLLYAHWEGFIKAASQHYYNFVTKKGYKLKELQDSFVAISIKKELNELIDSRKIVLQSKALSILFSEFEKRALFPNEMPLKTSNLNFEMLEEYCAMIGIETLPFETKRQFINQRLVENRNNIAHGKYLQVNETDYMETFKLTISIMKTFKTSIENSASLAAYMRVT